MIWNETKECMSRDQMTALQSARLVKLVDYMYHNVEFYRKKMQAVGLMPGDIKSIEDLTKLPFTTKDDLRDNYPFGLFAVPNSEIVRIHASSGTTGKATVVGYTRRDLDIWAECVARCMTMAGVSKNDIIQIAYGYGLFTGGLGAHDGATRIGATVIPMSSGNTPLQIQNMIDFGATILCCTPSYALYIGEEIEKAGLKDQLKLKAGIFGAEPWSESMRREIEEKLGIKAYDIYGLSEILGPGVGCECPSQAGMHIWEDHFIPEIIDPDTCEVLPKGATGELVLTTITKEGFPAIRYRTRDICSLDYTPCACGRTHVRMRKPNGRSDDMLIIRGVNVFPSQVEEVLLAIGEGEITPNYFITVDRVDNNDTFDLDVEMSESFFADDVKSIAAVEKKIADKLRSALGLGVRVHLVNPNSIARSEGKAKRAIDKRKI